LGAYCAGQFVERQRAREFFMHAPTVENSDFGFQRRQLLRATRVNEIIAVNARVNNKSEFIYGEPLRHFFYSSQKVHLLVCFV
jgi:hypothetical protein